MIVLELAEEEEEDDDEAEQQLEEGEAGEVMRRFRTKKKTNLVRANTRATSHTTNLSLIRNILLKQKTTMNWICYLKTLSEPLYIEREIYIYSLVY